MSGGKKSQFKQFNITRAEDACIALEMLIFGVNVNLDNIGNMCLRQKHY